MSTARQEAMLQKMEHDLHDLCQPLTTLQCRLELGLMCGDDVSLREAVEGSLMETARLFQGIEAMRERLLREMGGATGAAQAERD